LFQSVSRPSLLRFVSESLPLWRVQTATKRSLSLEKLSAACIVPLAALSEVGVYTAVISNACVACFLKRHRRFSNRINLRNRRSRYSSWWVRAIRNLLTYTSLPLLRKKRARRKVYSFFRPAIRLSSALLATQGLRLNLAKGLVSFALAAFYTRHRNPYFKVLRRAINFNLVLSRFYHKLERRRSGFSHSFSRIRNFIKGSSLVIYKAGSFRKRSLKLRSLIWRGKPNFNLKLIYVRLRQYFNLHFTESQLGLLASSSVHSFLLQRSCARNSAAVRAAMLSAKGNADSLKKKISFFSKIPAFVSAASSPLALLQHSLIANSLQVSH
jgi:hypothetical protein